MKYWKEYLAAGVLFFLLLPMFGCEGCSDSKNPTEPSDKTALKP